MGLIGNNDSKSTEEIRKGGSHGDTIGEVHASLFSRGILTKSMVKLYLTCPEKFRMQYVEKQEIKNTFHLSVGKAVHDTFEEWGKRKLAGEELTAAEARRLTSERWDVHMDGVELIDCTRDSKLGDCFNLYTQWQSWHRHQVTPRVGKLTGAEVSYGYDGSIKLGDVPIAGHIDCEWENGVTDFKIVKNTSSYLKPKWIDMERIMYAVMTGKRKVYLTCGIHNYKRVPKDGYWRRIGEDITDAQIDIAANIIGGVRDAIMAGNFPPPQHVVDVIGMKKKDGGGLFPCSKDWCDWYGKCAVTKGHENV